MWKFGILALLGLISTTYAAIIYLPVQSEYGTQQRYYYGGDDAAFFARAERTSASLQISKGPAVTNLPIRTYSDALPYQPNAGLFGFTANDARNAAYAAVPRYFSMADLRPAQADVPAVASAVPPANSGVIEIKPYVRALSSTTQPSRAMPPVANPAK